MKRLFSILMVVAMLAVTVPAVMAQSATNETWTSSITYYTPSTTGGSLQIDYYAANGTKYSAPAIALGPHKAGSLFIGDTSVPVPDGFKGSAVLSSDVPVVATYVQFSSANASTYGRILYNAFSPEAASATFYVPTVLRAAFANKTTSRIGIQNIESFEITAKLSFYASGSATPIVVTKDIPAQSSYVFLTSEISTLPAGFNGSLVITANKKGDVTTPGRVVAASEETGDTDRFAYAFEGVSQGANTIYMPSMLCQYLTVKQNTYYAVQNSGTTTATVVAKFAYGTNNTQSNPILIAPGAKVSIDPCAHGVPAGSSGSAVLESTGAPIIAVAKVSASNGLVTAFVGQSQGATKIALPYIRWASDANVNGDYRSYIAIMNVGTVTATNVHVKYYNAAGTMVADHALPAMGPNLKGNSDPKTAGALTSNDANGSFGLSPVGGAVEITSDQPIVVVVRMQRPAPAVGAGKVFGEDYNGTVIP